MNDSAPLWPLHFELIVGPCPNSCRHCYAGFYPGRLKTAMSVEQIVSILDRMEAAAEDLRLRYQERFVANLYPEGIAIPGYPDVLRDKIESLQHVEVEGHHDTTGSAFYGNNPLARARMASVRKPGDWLQVALHGKPDFHGYIVRMPNAFDRLMQTAQTAYSLGVNLSWQIYLYHGHAADFLWAKEHVQSISPPGRFKFQVMTFTGFGNGAEIEHLRPELDDLEPLEQADRQTILDYYRLTEGQWCASLAAGEPMAIAPPRFHGEPDLESSLEHSSPMVFPDGTVQRHQFNTHLGNLNDQSLMDVVDAWHRQSDREQAMGTLSPAELSRRYGNRQGPKLFDAPSLWFKWASAHADALGFM